MKVLVWLAVLGLSGVAGAQGNAGVTVMRFSFEKAEMAVPRYEVEVTAGGIGTYEEPGLPAQALRVSAAEVATIFAAKYLVQNNRCGTSEKNIADTGKKTLQYTGPAGKIACVFNYSDEEKVRAATGVFQAMAETIQEGEKLERERRFDRLAMDAEMDFLTAAVKDGSAIEVQNIAGVLQGIVGDERVMERVRLKAGRLLDAVAK